MAFTYQSKAETASLSSSDPVTLACTLSSGDNLLVLAIMGLDNGARTGGTPTYNGSDMTQAETEVLGYKECSCEIWYHLSPDTGASYNISVPNSGSKNMRLNACWFTTAATPEYNKGGTDNAGGSTAATGSVTLTSLTTGDAVVSAFGGGHKDIISANSDTLLYSHDEGAWNDASQYEIAAGGDTTHTFTQGDDDVAMVAATWKEGVANLTINEADANPDVTDAATVEITPYLVNEGDDNPDITDAATVEITPYLVNEGDDNPVVTDWADVDIVLADLDINEGDAVGVSDAATVHQIDLLPNCDLYYRCEDNANNSTVYDSAGNYDGSMVNDQNNYTSEQSTSSGKIDSAFDLATNDYIDANSALQSIFQGSFTVGLWINLDDGQNGTQALFGGNDTDGSERALIYLGASGNIFFEYHANSNGTTAQSTNQLPNGPTGWQHLVCVADSTVGGNYGLRIYLNGSEVAYNTIGDTSGITFGDFAGGFNPFVGCLSNDGTPSNFGPGIYDEIGIWSEALNSSEVQSLYNNGNGLVYPFGADLSINEADDNPDVTDYADVSITAGDLTINEADDNPDVTDAATVEITPYLVNEGDANPDVTDAATVEITPYLVDEGDDNPDVTDAATVEITGAGILNINEADANPDVTDAAALELTPYLIDEPKGTAKAHYKLNDNAASTNVVDSIGTSNGTLVGGDNTSDLSIAGAVNKALDLDGAADYIDANDTYEGVFRKSFSISWWGKPNDGQPSTEERWFGVNDSGHANSFTVQHRTNGDVRVGMTNSSGSFLCTSDLPVFSNGVQPGWTHIVFVADSTVGGVGGAVLYVNDSLIDLNATEDGDTSGITFDDYTSSRNLFIGDQNNNGSPAGKYFAGGIDNVEIYERALSAAEVTYLYNGGSGRENEINTTDAATVEITPYLVDVADDNPNVSDYANVQVTSADLLNVNVADDLGLSDAVTVQFDKYLVNEGDDNPDVSDAATIEITPYLVNEADDNPDISDAATVQLDKYLTSQSDAVGCTDAAIVQITPLLINEADNVGVSGLPSVEIAGAAVAAVAFRVIRQARK
jgi:hypothetical protein